MDLSLRLRFNHNTESVRKLLNSSNLHIDFSDTDTVDVTGSNIDEVRDKSRGIVFTPKTGEAPTITTYNGLQIGDFTGTQLLVTTLGNSVLYNNTKGFSAFAVRRVDNTNSFQTIIGQYRTTATAERIWRLEADRALVQSNKVTFNGDEVTLRSAYNLQTGWEITGMVWKPGEAVECYRGEVLIDTASLPVTSLPTATVEQLAIGGSNASASTGATINGAIAEILVFDRALTQSQVSTLVKYLHDKWF